jgi:DNA-binding NarL/FixJ family response regulator
MIKIVVIDERKRDRDLLCSVLSGQNDFEIAGFGKDEYDSLKLSAKFQPDIIIIDLGKHKGEGPELIPLIKRKSPATAIIFLSSRDDSKNAARALSSGALGYLLKDTGMDKLVAAVRTVYNGGCFISPTIAVRTFGMLSELTKFPTDHRTSPFVKTRRKSIPGNLSRMELQIISFIAKGYSNKEIAETLQLTQGTIRNYLSSAMHKTGLKSRTQVVIYALTNGIIDPDEYAC